MDPERVSNSMSEKNKIKERVLMREDQRKNLAFYQEPS
jgi:hypothetical protein